ncbi:MAG: TrkH family potassium uptake protein [Clostridia bacterium]|nr:TrkH family potassium uptake protein [Clostridia bacterium]
MSIRYIFYLCSRIFFVLAILMVLPILVSLIYNDGCVTAFLIPALVLVALGLLGGFKKPAKGTLFAKEGFAVVTIIWIVFAVFGAMPFMISGTIPRFADAFFETVSGFTTTGSTILSEVETLPNSIQFWRHFIVWIGGMGVLAFALAILPIESDKNKKRSQSVGSDVYIIRAESPGPMFGKLVPKLRFNVQILYLIYAVMTLAEIILLLLGGMDLFDSVCHSFASAGTGGFSTKNASIGAYDSAYIETVIGVFILMFGINFNIFYFLLTKNILGILKSDELRWYLIIVASAVLLITLDIRSLYGDFFLSLRYAFFQVASIITTSGFATTDFDLWSSFSKGILVLLMFCGGCASSTAGGLKVSRLIIMVKTALKEIRYYLNPREVRAIRCDGNHVPQSVVTGVSAYFVVYMLIFAVSVLLITLAESGQSLETCFTAVATCFNNVGPGLDAVGPTRNFGFLSDVSKYLLSINMLLGRLELFPILALFSKTAWKH